MSHDKQPADSTQLTSLVEDQLASELRKVERLETIARLAGGLGHDFNNLLAIMFGNLNMAQAKCKRGEPIEEELAIVRNAFEQACMATKEMTECNTDGIEVVDFNEQRECEAEQPTPCKDTPTRVLIMDDNDCVRAVLRAMLESVGYQVEDTMEGSSCVRAYQAAIHAGEAFDLVILALTIPIGHGGVWAFEQLRKIDAHVQGIIVSGDCNDAAMERRSGLGFQGSLQKPFEMRELQREVERVLLLASQA